MLHSAVSLFSRLSCLFGSDLAAVLIVLRTCVKQSIQVVIVHTVQEIHVVLAVLCGVIYQHIENVSVFGGDSDELHFLAVIHDLFRLDNGSVAVRVIIRIIFIVGSNIGCACFGKLSHDLTELLHIIGIII